MIRKYTAVAAIMTCLHPAFVMPVVAQTPAAQIEEILGQFEGSMASFPAAVFREHFGHAVQGRSDPEIETFLEVFGQAPRSDALSLVFSSFNAEDQRDIVTLILGAYAEHTHGPIGRITTRAIGLIRLEDELRRVVAGEHDGRNPVFIDTMLPNFMRDYPRVSAAVYTRDRLEIIWQNYEYQVSLLEAYIAEMEAQAEVYREQAEAYREQAGAYRARIRELDQQLEFLRALLDAS